jgi:1,4-dihydroxy-2-naphthoate octaprenyltransferase
VKPWIDLQELPKHLANLLPFALGTVLAWWYAGTVDWTVFAVSLAALYFLTNGTYIANEYFDYDNDRANVTRIGGPAHVGVTTTGGTRVLVNGLIARKHALVAAIACFAAAVPLGLWLELKEGTGPATIPLGILAIFIGWFYSAPPIKASYRGLGEVFIAAAQGLVVFGAFYVQQGASVVPVIASLSWFVALPALKILREFPDFDADRATAKRGLVVIFGRERMALLYSILIMLAIVLLIPVQCILRSPMIVLALIPASLLARSAWIMSRGEWRSPARLEVAAKSAFIGMLLIPVSLAIAFVLTALQRW